MTRAAFGRTARELAAIGERFHGRGWVLGTSGNFSAVVTRRPMQLAITASGVHKRALTQKDFLAIDAAGRVIGPATPASLSNLSRAKRGKPSAEAKLHLEIVSARGAGAVLHTHSVWGTILSDLHARNNGIAISGLEMLKGLDGVITHEHREWIPIVENDQDIERLARVVRDLLREDRAVHAFLLRGHGLYTWGPDIATAERHVEILEFLLEAVGRRTGTWR